MKTGEKFNELTVIKLPFRTHGKLKVWCRCVCGTEKLIIHDAVASGRTKSCGCLRLTNLRQALGNRALGTPSLHKIWSHLRQRCQNPNDAAYASYGGRGITVCERWQKFENFYADMGDRPKGKTLDRIDNSKGYSPENCRWATAKEQGRNKRNNVKFSYAGKELTLAEWGEITGVAYKTLHRRIRVYGWSIEKALTTPKLLNGGQFKPKELK